MFNETEIKQIVAINVLLAATKCTKFVFGRGPAGGAQDPLVCWGGVHSLPMPLPLGAYGASILTPSAPRFQRSATSFFTV